MRKFIVDGFDGEVIKVREVVEITDEMVQAYDEAEEATPGNFVDQIRAGLRAALEAAGFTVAADGDAR